MVPSGIFSIGSGKIWLDDLECLGSEDSLSACLHNGWGEHDCGHAEDVSITCLPNPLASKFSHVLIHPVYSVCADFVAIKQIFANHNHSDSSY